MPERSDIESRKSLLRWLQTIPHSRATYPGLRRYFFRFVIGRLYSPFHPIVRDIFLAIQVIRHHGRQDFLLGHLAPDRSAREFLQHLLDRGYRNHYFAWKDDGELVSLRRLDGFAHQYHLRLFEDGEVRAHYEPTPEAHPIRHMRDEFMEPRTEEFLADVGPFVTPRL